MRWRGDAAKRFGHIFGSCADENVLSADSTAPACSESVPGHDSFVAADFFSRQTSSLSSVTAMAVSLRRWGFGSRGGASGCAAAFFCGALVVEGDEAGEDFFVGEVDGPAVGGGDGGV